MLACSHAFLETGVICDGRCAGSGTRLSKIVLQLANLPSFAISKQRCWVKALSWAQSSSLPGRVLLCFISTLVPQSWPLGASIISRHPRPCSITSTSTLLFSNHVAFFPRLHFF